MNKHDAYEQAYRNGYEAGRKDANILPGQNQLAIYDIEFCDGVGQLKRTIAEINQFGCSLVSVTQCGHSYTVFFKRLAHG